MTIDKDCALSVAERIGRIRESVSRACLKAGRRPDSVTLIGVTKTRTPEEIKPAIEAGLDDLGENYLQEAREKVRKLPGVRWHLIGNLQNNKANQAAELFEVIHSLDSVRLIKHLDRHCRERGCTVSGLIQVRLGGEDTKSGIEPECLIPMLDELSLEPPEALCLTGLMTIPPPVDDPEKSRPHFRRLRELLDEVLKRRYPFWHGAELSMGMTDDYLVAVEEGATFIRVGRAIFGERQYKQYKIQH